MGVAVLTLTSNPHAVEDGSRSSVRSSFRRAVIAASRPVSKLMSPVNPGFSDCDLPADDDFLVLLVDAIVGVG